VWIALAAWLVTAIGLAGAISRSVTAARSA
jgi:hypothetical protein